MTQNELEFDIDVINKCYQPLLDCSSRYLVLYGGAGSGKSYFAAEKLILRIMEEEGHKFLVVRETAVSLRQSTFSLLQTVISNWGLSELFKVNKTDMTIIFEATGSQIIHSGLDDVEKLKSIDSITGVWIEEADRVTFKDFSQLNTRLRGVTPYYKQIIVTFNPTSPTSWLKDFFFDNTPPEIKPDLTVKHTTYLDNYEHVGGDEYHKQMMAYKEADPEHYEVYTLGKWGVIGGTVFSSKRVNERLDALLKDDGIKKQGKFTFDYEHERIVNETIEWTRDEDNGQITIYELPKPNVPYVIGCDTSGDGSDYFAAHVINNITGNQVAVYHYKEDEDLFTRQMYCLGRYYNEALIAIESNFSSYPIKELQRLGYERQYIRETVDTVTSQRKNKFGFHTNKATRPQILANLIKIVREHSHVINHIGTLNEMHTFVKNDRGREEAMAGKHDDLIMSLAIAHFIRDRQDIVEQVEEKVKEPLPFPFRTDLDEDYSSEGFDEWY